MSGGMINVLPHRDTLSAQSEPLHVDLVRERSRSEVHVLLLVVLVILDEGGSDTSEDRRIEGDGTVRLTEPDPGNPRYYLTVMFREVRRDESRGVERAMVATALGEMDRSAHQCFGQAPRHANASDRDAIPCIKEDRPPGRICPPSGRHSILYLTCTSSTGSTSSRHASTPGDTCHRAPCGVDRHVPVRTTPRFYVNIQYRRIDWPSHVRRRPYLRGRNLSMPTESGNGLSLRCRSFFRLHSSSSM